MRDIRINREKYEVILTRKFAEKADDPRTEEFRLLQEVMATYPNITVKNHTIKKKPNKECYRGLTYKYMEEFIKKYEPNADSVLEEFEELIFISEGHSKAYRYPTIKKWFLEKYPDFSTFGTDTNEYEKRKAVEIKLSKDEEVAAA